MVQDQATTTDGLSEITQKPSITVQEEAIASEIKTDHLPLQSQPGRPCGLDEGTQYQLYGKWFALSCNVDFFAQDIFPFILAATYEDCLQYCFDYNKAHGDYACAGFVYAPDRVHLDNNCYLKSSLNHAIRPATLHLIGGSMMRPQPYTTGKDGVPLYSTMSATVTSVATQHNTVVSNTLGN